MGAHIFISYATVDGESYRVKEIAQSIQQDEAIEKVYYWEQDAEDDIMDYMNKYLTISEILILFCSPNVVNSQATEMEWKVALKLNKQIIPVFHDPKYIPALVTSKIGVQFTPNDFNGFVENLKDKIYRRTRIVRQRAMEADRGPAEVHQTFVNQKYKVVKEYQGVKQLVIPKGKKFGKIFFQWSMIGLAVGIVILALI